MEQWIAWLDLCGVAVFAASTTSPLALVTLCLVDVASLTKAESTSRMIGVPRPAANVGLSMGADFP